MGSVLFMRARGGGLSEVHGLGCEGIQQADPIPDLYMDMLVEADTAVDAAEERLEVGKYPTPPPPPQAGPAQL